MENAIVVVILAAIVGGIVVYLYRAKKRGQTCIGCPYAKQCGGNCHEPKETQEAERFIDET